MFHFFFWAAQKEKRMEAKKPKLDSQKGEVEVEPVTKSSPKPSPLSSRQRATSSNSLLKFLQERAEEKKQREEKEKEEKERKALEKKDEAARIRHVKHQQKEEREKNRQEREDSRFETKLKRDDEKFEFFKKMMQKKYGMDSD